MSQKLAPWNPMPTVVFGAIALVFTAWLSLLMLVTVFTPLVLRGSEPAATVMVALLGPVLLVGLWRGAN